MNLTRPLELLVNKLEACTGTEQPKHLNATETVRDMSPCRVCIDEAVSNAVKDPDNAMGTLHALLHVGYIWPVFLAKMKVLLISSLLSPSQFGDPKDLRTCGRWHKKTTGGPNLTNSLKSNFETLRENHVVEFWDGLCTEEFDNFLQKFEKIWQLCMAVEEEHRTRKAHNQQASSAFRLGDCNLRKGQDYKNHLWPFGMWNSHVKHFIRGFYLQFEPAGLCR